MNRISIKNMDGTMEEVDLGNSGDAEIAEESFSTNSANEVLVENIDFLAESDDLPTPEELDSEKDFSRNE